jgi:hypothetical protein
VINENKHKQNVNNENHSMHHTIHEIVSERLHKVVHHRVISEDLIITLHLLFLLPDLHEMEDDQMDHSVCIDLFYSTLKE